MGGCCVSNKCVNIEKNNLIQPRETNEGNENDYFQLSSVIEDTKNNKFNDFNNKMNENEGPIIKLLMKKCENNPNE